MTEFRIANDVTPSFHQSIITYQDRSVSVVCDRNSPLLAIAEPRVTEPDGSTEFGPLTFLDLAELAAALADAVEFRVLTKNDLDRPFRAADWPSMSASDINYWKPATVGEALFNYWD